MRMLTVGSNRFTIKWDQLLSHLILALGAFLAFLPFLWMILSAFKSTGEIERLPPTFFPENPTLENFQDVFTLLDFPRLFFNSLFVTTVITLSVTYTSGIVGYVLERIRFPGRNMIFFFIIATMFVPNQITRIVLWSAFNDLGLLNTYPALILPFLYSAFGIFLLKQNMHTIPEEILDAARIDGASEIGIYHRIVLPNILPSLSALAIFQFMFAYDEFFWPLIALDDVNMYTIPLGLSFFQGQYYNNLGFAFAGTTIAILPTIIVFIVLQRQIIQGITLTGLKG